MSRKARIKLTLLSLMILIITVSAHSPERLQYPAAHVKTENVEGNLEGLSTYRKWTLVNPVPVKMEHLAAQLCAVAVPTNENPHRDKFISVYVNETGREAMMQQLVPEFPQGSMIVKEKLGTSDSQSPELLTAMIKREKGYDPRSGDWEYLVLDGAATNIVKRGRLTSCSSCHAAYKKTDYVTRAYLSDATRRQLK